MTYLRELLKTKEPELNNALENAWRIAKHDIFPVLYSKDESLNSAPHSQNIENYLNSIFIPFEDTIFNENSPIYLSPYELYCILMAILFHDSGRIMCESGHGSFSKLYIKKNYEKFFIPSEELAEAISDICDFHKSFDPLFNPVAIVLDAGKGRVRVRELSELLILVDEMDNTYRRLKNLYVLDQSKYYTGKAVFRNYIKGMSYNSIINAVIVSIDNKLEENTELNAKYTSVRYRNLDDDEVKSFNEKKYKKNDLLEFIKKELKSINVDFNIKSNDIRRDIFEKIRRGVIRVELILNSDDFTEEQFITALNQAINSEKPNSAIEKEKYNFIKSIKKCQNNTEKMRLYNAYLYYNKKGSSNEIMKKIEKIAEKKWPLFVVIPSILSAIEDCRKKTQNFKFIDRLGIHVEDWLIYYKEHLFNSEGKEVCEPIFDYYYLLKIVESMEEMISYTPLQKYYSFEELKSKTLENDEKKLRLALQRIEILTRDYARSDNFPTLFSYDNKQWCWEGKINSFTEVYDCLKKLN